MPQFSLFEKPKGGFGKMYTSSRPSLEEDKLAFENPSFQDEVADFMRKPRVPIMNVPVATSPEDYPRGTRPDTDLEKLQDRERAMNTPMTRKQKIFGSLAQAVPVALGGIFGGSEGASGAAEGVNSFMREKQAWEEGQKGSLQKQIADEKARQDRLRQEKLEADWRHMTFAQQKAQWEAQQGQWQAEEKRANMSLQEQVRHNKEMELANRRGAKEIQSYVNKQGRQVVVFEEPDGRITEKVFGEVQPKRDTSITPFEVWQGQNQGKPVDEYLKLTKPSWDMKPPTAAETTAYGFYNRAEQADKDANDLEKWVKDLGLYGQAWLKFAPNFMQTDNGQLYQQAQRVFTEARLRKESGAAIAQHEYDNDARMYFAQPGDSETTIARKRAARAKVLEGLKLQSGRAYSQSADDGASAPRAKANREPVDNTPNIIQFDSKGNRVK